MTSTQVEPVGAADHLEAWKTRLAALTAVPALDRDDVQGLDDAALPDDYLVLDVGERVGSALRLNNTSDTIRRGWFLSVLVVGRYSTNCLRVRGRLASLRFTRLTIAGATTSPINLDAADYLPDDVDGRWEQRSEWTYTYP